MPGVIGGGGARERVSGQPHSEYCSLLGGVGRVLIRQTLRLQGAGGGIFSVIPAQPQSRAHLYSFPGFWPVCYHLSLTGIRLGYGWGRAMSGDRGRECRKGHLPQANEWGEAGKRARGRRFSEPSPSSNEL